MNNTDTVTDLPPFEEVLVPQADEPVVRKMFVIGEDKHQTLMHWESNLGAFTGLLVNAMTASNIHFLADKQTPMDTESEPLEWARRLTKAYEGMKTAMEGLLDEEAGLPAMLDRVDKLCQIMKRVSEGEDAKEVVKDVVDDEIKTDEDKKED